MGVRNTLDMDAVRYVGVCGGVCVGYGRVCMWACVCMYVDNMHDGISKQNPDSAHMNMTHTHRHHKYFIMN